MSKRNFSLYFIVLFMFMSKQISRVVCSTWFDSSSSLLLKFRSLSRCNLENRMHCVVFTKIFCICAFPTDTLDFSKRRLAHTLSRISSDMQDPSSRWPLTDCGVSTWTQAPINFPSWFGYGRNLCLQGFGTSVPMPSRCRHLDGGSASQHFPSCSHAGSRKFEMRLEVFSER